jgi:hypothetical protein
MFKNTNKVTIVTPSYRLDNLPKIKESIDFDYVDEWIIVYDGTKIKTHPLLFQHEENSKIKEYIIPTTTQNATKNQKVPDVLGYVVLQKTTSS